MDSFERTTTETIEAESRTASTPFTMDTTLTFSEQQMDFLHTLTILNPIFTQKRMKGGKQIDPRTLIALAVEMANTDEDGMLDVMKTYLHSNRSQKFQNIANDLIKKGKSKEELKKRLQQKLAQRKGGK